MDAAMFIIDYAGIFKIDYGLAFAYQASICGWKYHPCITYRLDPARSLGYSTGICPKVMWPQKFKIVHFCMGLIMGILYITQKTFKIIGPMG